MTVILALGGILIYFCFQPNGYISYEHNQCWPTGPYAPQWWSCQDSHRHSFRRLRKYLTVYHDIELSNVLSTMSIISLSNCSFHHFCRWLGSLAPAYPSSPSLAIQWIRHLGWRATVPLVSVTVGSTGVQRSVPLVLMLYYCWLFWKNPS